MYFMYIRLELQVDGNINLTIGNKIVVFLFLVQSPYLSAAFLREQKLFENLFAFDSIMRMYNSRLINAPLNIRRIGFLLSFCLFLFLNLKK